MLSRGGNNAVILTWTENRNVSFKEIKKVPVLATVNRAAVSLKCKVLSWEYIYIDRGGQKDDINEAS